MKPFFTLLMLCCAAFAATAGEPVPFNGLLLDAQGRPIRSARVYVSDPEKYARTDKKGRFGLTDVQPTDTIRIRHEKQTYEIPVEGRRSMRIRLFDQLRSEAEESSQLIDFGFSYVRQREYIGYNSRITGEELQRTGCTDILSALSGLIPGVEITEDPENGTYAVSIRGGGYGDNTTPLYVVDDVIVSSLDHLQLAQVAYVVVMKDATVYGFRGANGAIVVRTKSAETARSL